MNYEEQYANEIEHFHGSKAYEIMKGMSWDEMIEFLELTKDDENAEFPYIWEYRWFIRLCIDDVDGLEGVWRK